MYVYIIYVRIFDSILWEDDILAGGSLAIRLSFPKSKMTANIAAAQDQIYVLKQTKWVASGHPAKITLKLRTIATKCKTKNSKQTLQGFRAEPSDYNSRSRFLQLMNPVRCGLLMSQNNYVRDLRQILIMVNYVKYITATRHLSKQTLLHTLDTLTTFP